MSRYGREEIMSSSEVVRNFGSVLNSVSQHTREKVAIVRNNKLEAVLLPVDVYEQMERVCEMVKNGHGLSGGVGNSGALLEFLRTNRLSAAARMSPKEIEQQILEEREAWE